MNSFTPQNDSFNCRYARPSKWVQHQIARLSIILDVFLDDIPDLPSKIAVNPKVSLE